MYKIPITITDENIKFFEKQNTFLINMGQQFIIDCCKTFFYNTKNTENYETTLVELFSDKRNISAFYKRTILSFKELYSLSSDLYQFKNNFFEIKQKNIDKLKSDKKGKNLILEKIDIFRKHDNLILNFVFKTQFNIGNIFYNKLFDIEIIIGVFKNNQFNIDKTSILNFKNNLTIENLREQIKILNELKNEQIKFEKFIHEKSNSLNILNKNIFNELKHESESTLYF